MATVDEISPDVFRIATYVPQFDLEFCHFLVRDEQPLLWHAGFRSSFPELAEAVRQVLDPATIRWVGFSHFESDECGALNHWLDLAPRAEALCSFLAAAVNVGDFASRPPKGMADEERLETGSHRFRFLNTRHVPHGWDGGVLFEETGRVLFCSDLLLQPGQNKPVTDSDILERATSIVREWTPTPFGFATPYTPSTDATFRELAGLQPSALAVMHGSCYTGDGASALLGYAECLKESYRP